MLKKMGFQGWNAYAKKSMDSLAASVVELRKNPNAAKILTLKIVMLSFLITAATTITILSQRRLAKAEYRLFVSRFHSVSDNAIISVSESLSHVNLNIREMSVTFGHVFPDAAQWPNVAWKGFQPTAAILSNISAVGGMGILPIVLPEQVPAYQDFISAYYDTDPYCDRATYMNPYYPNGEIWDTFDSSEFPPLFTADPFGNTTDSPYQILTPISQYTFSSIVGPHGVGFNLHSEPALTRTIDLVINCTKELNYPCASSYCGTVSPAIPVPYPSAEDTHPTATDMVAVFLHPIFPADNQSALVGFAAGTFSWKALLTNVIPKDVSDIDCVIEVDGKVFTFCIQDGIPYFKGEGSRQESAYTYMRRRSAILGQHITVSTGEPYIVNFYPTRAFEQQYETNRPERGALVLFCSFAFCTILFGSYDLLLRREFDRNQAVLDTKRRFVRFISHEIRTPLNTVRLGMKLLEVEIGKLVSTLSSTPAASLAPLVLKTLETWKQLADEIVESSESAVEVLNDLLNYDKIEIGALKLELSYMNVRELVDRTVAAMQVQAQQKGITLELHCPCPKTAVMLFGVPDPDLEVGGYDDADDEDEVEDRTVVGDTARMGQVLRNLISNALKFTPSDGQVSISVIASDAVTGIPEKIRESSELYHDVTHVGTLSIAVKDSGAGLSPQQLAEICAEGVQFNANELQAGQGSGLGLFISKGIAEQHGGKLVVESEGLGKGVTFTAELPLFRRRPVSESMRSLASRRSRSESLNSERTSAMPMMNHISSSTSSAHTVSIERAVAAAATAAGIVAPCRLLVVDDSMLNRKMMIRLLSSKDHVCEQAEDGEAGIRKYLEMVERGEPPDAILMDYEMPVMNGPSATARLRELGCTCLIVGVTGNVLPHDRAFFIAHGANGVLPKPIVLEEFEQLLAGSLLRLSQQHQTQHQHQPQQHQHQHQREQQQGGSAYAAEVTAGFALSEKPPAKSASMTLSTTAKIHPEQLV